MAYIYKVQKFKITQDYFRLTRPRPFETKQQMLNIRKYGQIFGRVKNFFPSLCYQRPVCFDDALEHLAFPMSLCPCTFVQIFLC